MFKPILIRTVLKKMDMSIYWMVEYTEKRNDTIPDKAHIFIYSPICQTILVEAIAMLYLFRKSHLSEKNVNITYYLTTMILTLSDGYN